MLNEGKRKVPSPFWNYSPLTASRGSTATYLHIPPPEFWISATSDGQPASKRDKLVSCMASYPLGEFIECLWTRSLSLRMLQFPAPCQYAHTLYFSSCLFWVEGWRRNEPRRAGWVLGSCQFWGPYACTSHSLVFLYSSTSSFCLLAVSQPWTALNLHSTVSQQYL